MRLPPPGTIAAPRNRNLRILVMALLIGLLVSVAGTLNPIESGMKIIRAKLRSHPASGAIMVVAIDDRSLAELGPMPWPRERLAGIVSRLRASGVRRIFIDTDLSRAGQPADDAKLDAAMARTGGGLLLPARFSIDTLSEERVDNLPLPRFARHARLVNTNLWVDRGSYVWSQPYAARFGEHLVPSLASALGGVTLTREDRFPIDYAIDVRSVPVISASDILRGKSRAADVAGRDVLIGQTSSAVEHYNAPGFALVPGLFFHVIAAETLLSGQPVEIGWVAALFMAAGIAAAFLFTRNRVLAKLMLTAGVLLLIVGPVLLESVHVFITVCPAILVLLVTGAARTSSDLRRAFQARGTTNPVSGLPNLNALRQAGAAPSETVIVARIQNFAEITTALPADCEKELVEQIASRMGFGTNGAPVFQSDEGIFIWLAEAQAVETLVEQIDGLHALFRSPVIVSARLVDLSVTFGLDTDFSRPVIQRVSSALVAADAAAADGRRWMAYDPASIEDAEWKMSVLGQLDLAIRNNEIWVAYQPKLDLETGRIVGAEALARWLHPEKGEIFPNQFIPAAERSGRIENLTVHVLDTAIQAAAQINRAGTHFTIAVNLSARLLDEPELVPMVMNILAHHRLAPELLTLEVTETTAMAGQEESFANLERLSALGVCLSIDDYGTGFSTLEYLRRIPAAEIKIDRSFVGMLEKSQSDRIMVHSTIQLAHSLGRKAVAEGVENAATLNELRRMRCDMVQGYFTGRPMKLPALLERLARPGTAVAA